MRLHTYPHLPVANRNIGLGLFHGSGEPRVDEAETHRIHVHVIPAPFFCHGFGKPHHRRFPRRIASLARIAIQSGNGCNVNHFAHDNRPCLGFFLRRIPYPARSGPQQAKGRHDMNVQHALKLFIRGFLNDAVPGVTGVIHHNVYGAELRRKLSDCRFRKAARRQVASQCLHFGPI